MMSTEELLLRFKRATASLGTEFRIQHLLQISDACSYSTLNTIYTINPRTGWQTVWKLINLCKISIGKKLKGKFPCETYAYVGERTEKIHNKIGLGRTADRPQRQGLEHTPVRHFVPCCAGKIDCCPHITGFIEKKMFCWYRCIQGESGERLRNVGEKIGFNQRERYGDNQGENEVGLWTRQWERQLILGQWMNLSDWRFGMGKEGRERDNRIAHTQTCRQSGRWIGG